MTEMILSVEAVAIEDDPNKLQVNIYMGTTLAHTFTTGTSDKVEAVARAEEILASALGKLLQ